MGRFARVVAVDVPHHVTQRGNARQVILGSDEDRLTYLALLRQYSELHGMGLLGYCLMSNHVHLISVPHAQDALAQALKQAHGRYATYWNARRASSGHVWQGRFYSCPLDESHLWEALRYVELNPVRAGMVASAEEWRWSSARVHCGTESVDAMLERERWGQALDRERMATVHGGGSNRIRGDRTAGVYAHGTSARYRRICGADGEGDAASAGTAKRRPTKEANRRHAADEG